MTSEHDVTLHERLASLETNLGGHADRVEARLGEIVTRLDRQNGRVGSVEDAIDDLQNTAERTTEWKTSRDDRIGDLQAWRLETDLAKAVEQGRQQGRRELRKGDIAKLATAVAVLQAAIGLVAWGAGLF